MVRCGKSYPIQCKIEYDADAIERVRMYYGYMCTCTCRCVRVFLCPVIDAMRALGMAPASSRVASRIMMMAIYCNEHFTCLHNIYTYTHIHMYTYIYTYIHTCECVMSLPDVFCEYVPPNKFGLCVFLSKRNIRKCINGRIINRTHHSRAMIARMQRSLKHRLISGRVRDTMKMDLCESKYLGGSQCVPLCVCGGWGVGGCGSAKSSTYLKEIKTNIYYVNGMTMRVTQ